jgi:hypothetical protein
MRDGLAQTHNVGGLLLLLQELQIAHLHSRCGIDYYQKHNERRKMLEHAIISNKTGQAKTEAMPKPRTHPYHQTIGIVHDPHGGHPQ